MTAQASRTRLFATTIFAGAALLYAGAAAAQDAGAAPTVETITVTAQRLSQDVQDVPLAITALSERELDRQGIVNLRQMRDVVPGLYIEENLNNTSTPKLFLRGIGIDNSAFSFDSPIGVYVDDVYYPRAAGSLIDFFDLDRIEVLRGPQGTIYGRNSSIGAIRVITKRPPLDQMDLKADVTYGTRNQFNTRIAWGVPLVQDRLGLRLAYNHKQNDGFMKNLANGERAKSDDVDAFRGQLRFQATEDLSIILRGDYMRDRGRETAASNFVNNPDDDLLTYESNRSYRDGTAINELDTHGVSVTVNWALDGADLTAITAWRGVETKKAFDADGSTAATFEVARGDLQQDQFTQEVYLAGSDIGSAPISWVAGAFYLKEENDYVYAMRVAAPPNAVFFDQTVESVAAYGQGIWRVTDTVNLTAGARYTFETKDFAAVGFDPAGVQLFDFLATDLERKKWTWRLAADWKVADNILVFASASTGFRSGGLNGNAATLPEITSGAFGPEDTLMYEAGFKADFFDRRLVVNASAYWGKYEGLQQAITTTSGAVSSVNNDADVRGVDLEVVARPVQGLSLRATAATFHSDISNSDLILKQSPDFQYTLAADYEWELGGLGTAGIGASYNWTDKVFENATNQEIVATPAHETANAYASFEPAGSRWKVTGGVYNLTDEVYSAGGFYIAGGRLSAVKYPTLPRRYYVTVRYAF